MFSPDGTVWRRNSHKFTQMTFDDDDDNNNNGLFNNKLNTFFFSYIGVGISLFKITQWLTDGDQSQTGRKEGRKKGRKVGRKEGRK